MMFNNFIEYLRYYKWVLNETEDMIKVDFLRLKKIGLYVVERKEEIYIIKGKSFRFGDKVCRINWIPKKTLNSFNMKLLDHEPLYCGSNPKNKETGNADIEIKDIVEI